MPQGCILGSHPECTVNHDCVVRVAVGWGADLQIFLGDVELLFVAEVDLSHVRGAVSACIRDAAAWLWRVRAVCAGFVCIEKPFVARGAEGE